MKYTDEQIDSFLNAMGVKLLPYQRELFNKMVRTDKVYMTITMPPRVGYYDYIFAARVLETILKGEK